MGEDTHYFAFETEDGQTIDVDRIKNYKSSRSSEMLSMNTAEGIHADTKAMVNAAVKQGIVSRAVAGRVHHKLRVFDKRVENYKDRGENNPFFKKEVQRAKLFNEHIRSMLDRSAEQLDKKFNYGGDEVSRASNVLLVRPSRSYISDRSVEVAEALEKITGMDFLSEDSKGNPVVKRSPSFIRFVQSKVVEDLMRSNPTMPSHEVLAQVMGDLVMDEGYLKSFITGGDDIKDPSKYYSSYSEQAEIRVKDMISKGKLPGSLKDNLNRLNFIVALTSPQNQADTNIESALEVLEASYNVKGKDPSDMIGFEIIDFISNGKADGVKIDRSKMPYTRGSIASLVGKI